MEGGDDVCSDVAGGGEKGGGRGRRGEEDLVPFQYTEQAGKLVGSQSI